MNTLLKTVENNDEKNKILTGILKNKIFELTTHYETGVVLKNTVMAKRAVHMFFNSLKCNPVKNLFILIKLKKKKGLKYQCKP